MRDQLFRGYESSSLKYGHNHFSVMNCPVPFEPIQTFVKFWITSDFFAVGLFAFAGVAVRVGIQNSLDGRVEANTIENYGPFMQMFHAHTFLLCNIVGCFIMSFCIAHTTQISNKSPHLYKGLTTGFCGSLTTFSSWMNGCINILWDRYWYKYLLTLLLEFWLTWAAFTMGYACAKMVDSAYVHFFPTSEGTVAQINPQNSDAPRTNSSDPLTQHIELTHITTHTDASHPQRVLNDDENVHLSGRGLSQLNSEREDQLDRYEIIECGADDHDRSIDMDALRQRPSTGAAGAHATTNINNRDTDNYTTNTNKSTHNTQQHSMLTTLHHYEYYIWGTLLSFTCIIVWSILGTLPYIHYYDNTKLRNTYRAVALAPLGAWARWGLTRFPGIKNFWPDMHPQTLIANITGVTFMCALTVYSSSSWVYAVDTGFNGSLTTVSTFFAELHALYLEKGPYVSLRYCLTTFCLAIAVIEILRAGHAADS